MSLTRFFRVEFNAAMRLVAEAKKALGDDRVGAFLHLYTERTFEGSSPNEVRVLDEDRVSVGTKNNWYISPGSGTARVKLSVSISTHGIRVDMYQIDKSGTVIPRTDLHTDRYREVREEYQHIFEEFS